MPSHLTRNLHGRSFIVLFHSTCVSWNLFCYHGVVNSVSFQLCLLEFVLLPWRCQLCFIPIASLGICFVTITLSTGEDPLSHRTGEDSIYHQGRTHTSSSRGGKHILQRGRPHILQEQTSAHPAFPHFVVQPKTPVSPCSTPLHLPTPASFMYLYDDSDTTDDSGTTHFQTSLLSELPALLFGYSTPFRSWSGEDYIVLCFLCYFVYPNSPQHTHAGTAQAPVQCHLTEFSALFLRSHPSSMRSGEDVTRTVYCVQ